MTRNESWWNEAKPAWDNVTIRYVKSPPPRGWRRSWPGDVDLIDKVSVQDVDRIKADARFQVATGIADEVVGFVFDVQDRSSPQVTGNDGRPLPVNPFRDKRVRQAVALAIDRSAIRDRIMNGQSSPDNQYMKPGQYGFDPDLPPPRTDLAEARRLLAEAGYPAGFHLVIDCQNDRFVNDAAICQAVSQMLARIGIAAQPEVMPHSVWVARGQPARVQHAPVYLDARHAGAVDAAGQPVGDAGPGQGPRLVQFGACTATRPSMRSWTRRC